MSVVRRADATRREGLPELSHESPAWTQHDDGRWWSEIDGVWNVLDEESGTWAVADDQLLPNELWAGSGTEEEQAREEERGA